MSKRACPFEDHLLPQLKVHVGRKQLINGVNKEQEMSKIYEKTLSLLKNGSKEFDQKLSICRENQPMKMASPQKNHSTKTSHLKQMIFDEKGKLRPTENDTEAVPQETCQSCKTTAVVAFTRCFYCNNFKCCDCLKMCAKCEEDFCHKCSLVVYEGGEHTKCLACYR